MSREQRYKNHHVDRSRAVSDLPVFNIADEPMAAADRMLVCRQCGKNFVFSIGEQEFYGQRGLSEPRRCPQCRASQRTERNNNGYRNPGQYYTVTCSDCGKETSVPFEPKQGRPVYCRDCYSRLKNETRVSPRQIC